MSYKVVGKDGKFCISEEGTDKIVDCYKKERQARAVCRNLNLGSGFQGWTPDFFCDTEINS